MISPEPPLPLNMGSRIRIFHSLRVLSENHEVTLVALVPDEKKNLDSERINELCERFSPIELDNNKSKTHYALKSLLSGKPYRVAKFESNEIKETVSHLLANNTYDISWSHFLNSAAYLDNSSKPPINVLDQHNADELMWQKYRDEGGVLTRFFGNWNIRQVKKFRERNMGNFDVILSVSEEDAKFTRGNVGVNQEVWTVPNGVDLDNFQPGDEDLAERDDVIVFCGSMDVKMNIDAVERFVKNSFPIIREQAPEAELWIVGKNPSASIKRLEDKKGIKVTGTVEDVLPYYHKAKVTVAPFRYGGGTKLKILEALATKVPIVSTSVGVQGIDVEKGEHVLIEDSLRDFGKQVLKLLKNPELGNDLAESGYELVRRKYSWRSLYGEVETRLRNL